jgi:hypothetical protein
MSATTSEHQAPRVGQLSDMLGGDIARAGHCCTFCKVTPTITGLLDSLLGMRLNKQLAGTEMGSPGAGPCDIGHELRHVVPPVKRCTPSHPATAASGTTHPQPRQPPSVPHAMLNDFAKKYDVDPDGILGSQKRPSPSDNAEPSAAKRPCATSTAAPTHAPPVAMLPAAGPARQEAGVTEPSDPVLAGMSAARRHGAPAKTTLSWLADQLGTCPGASTQSESQAATQWLHMTQTQERLPVLAPQAFDTSEAWRSRQNAAAARKQRQPRARNVRTSRVLLLVRPLG